jgi:uncharacterized protein YndB with AHSA1/START domain
MSNDPIVIELRCTTSVEKIWLVLTDRDAMKQWYFDFQEFRPEVGFEFRFWGGPAEDRQYLHICEITEVLPNKKLSYTWRYDGYPGNTLVTFDILQEADQTCVRLTHEGFETFPTDQPDFARENFVEGWNWIIGNSLKAYLEQN